MLQDLSPQKLETRVGLQRSRRKACQGGNPKTHSAALGACGLVQNKLPVSSADHKTCHQEITSLPRVLVPRFPFVSGSFQVILPGHGTAGEKSMAPGRTSELL